MEKEFIPYEQALELKELGFDEECIFIYQYPNLDVKVPAPLYQQAFRWFREKHDKLGCIQKANDRNRFIYLVNDIVFGFYNTYEEAELACLKKLIEIVKNK